VKDSSVNPPVLREIATYSLALLLKLILGTENRSAQGHAQKNRVELNRFRKKYTLPFQNQKTKNLLCKKRTKTILKEN
jgi:hypothetical protein